MFETSSADCVSAGLAAIRPRYSVRPRLVTELLSKHQKLISWLSCHSSVRQSEQNQSFPKCENWIQTNYLPVTMEWYLPPSHCSAHSELCGESRADMARKKLSVFTVLLPTFDVILVRRLQISSLQFTFKVLAFLICLKLLIILLLFCWP